MSRDLRLYLTDILIAGEKVLNYTEGMNFENFGGLAGFVWGVSFYAQSAQLAAPYPPGSLRFGASVYVC